MWAILAQLWAFFMADDYCMLILPLPLTILFIELRKTYNSNERLLSSILSLELFFSDNYFFVLIS